MLGTIPIVDDKLDFNPSFKVLVPLQEDSETAIAFNIGLGIKLFEGFTLRPEYGMLFTLKEEAEGHYKQFGIGVTYSPPRKTAEK
ncbi:MAG: hypothetical protein ACJAZ9_000395 [Neolewinella sp.]